MAQEEIKYNIPAGTQGDGTTVNGSQVDLIVTYDPSMQNADGSYTITDATGTYNTIDSNGQVVDQDTITGVAPAGTIGGNDNELFVVDDPTTTPIVTEPGIGFTIDNAGDSNDGNGNINFYDGSGGSAGTVPTDTPRYFEDGNNSNQAANVTEAAPCFATGTMIATTAGSVRVQDLTTGSDVICNSGSLRSIRWLGHRTVDCRNHPRSHEVMPIRISAHAFGENRPSRDLFVSPGHSICVDVLGEVLIPASALVNGSTVQQVEVDEVTYWHVELDSHDVILAENLPAESYLDMGNRGFFREADVVDLAVGPDADPAQRTHADFCRPFVDGGPVLEAVKAQLRRRAESLGWAHSNALEMHLVVDGQRLDPVVRGLTARFTVPAEAKDVWLEAPTSRPCDVTESCDGRDLGLFIKALRIDDGFEVRDIAIDDPLLCIGFHPVEEGSTRWTTGRARLPAALFEGFEHDFYLRVELAATPVPRWVGPAVEERPRLAIVA